MIVSWDEVEELEIFLEEITDSPSPRLYRGEDDCFVDEEDYDDRKLLRYFADRPHLLMPSGFDEYVGFDSREQYQDRWFAQFALQADPGQSIYRKPNGQWFWLYMTPEGPNGSFLFATPSGNNQGRPRSSLTVQLNEVLNRLTEIASDDEPSAEERLWTPSLWTPKAQAKERDRLSDLVRPILTGIRSEATTFHDLSWRQLEDIVAEVLRASGLKIHVVRQHPQGGRDIIAKGELIPGQEPLEFAVEVKHLEVVDRPEVQLALKQNEGYPVLLFVTSGRFTAGVYREKSKQENRLRLRLIDGVALGDMIQDYFRRTKF